MICYGRSQLPPLEIPRRTKAAIVYVGGYYRLGIHRLRSPDGPVSIVACWYGTGAVGLFTCYGCGLVGRYVGLRLESGLPNSDLTCT